MWIVWNPTWKAWAVTSDLEKLFSNVDNLALAYGPFTWGGENAEFSPHALHIPARDRLASSMLCIMPRHQFADNAYLSQEDDVRHLTDLAGLGANDVAAALPRVVNEQH